MVLPLISPINSQFFFPKGKSHPWRPHTGSGKPGPVCPYSSTGLGLTKGCQAHWGVGIPRLAHRKGDSGFFPLLHHFPEAGISQRQSKKRGAFCGVTQGWDGDRHTYHILGSGGHAGRVHPQHVWSCCTHLLVKAASWEWLQLRLRTSSQLWQGTPPSAGPAWSARELEPPQQPAIAGIRSWLSELHKLCDLQQVT